MFDFQNPSQLDISRVTPIRTNYFNTQLNPEEKSLNISRFVSPALRLGRVRSWKFTYQSPTRVENLDDDKPLAFK